MTNQERIAMKGRLFDKAVVKLSKAKEVQKRAISDVEFMTRRCIRLQREIDALEETK